MEAGLKAHPHPAHPSGAQDRGGAAREGPGQGGAVHRRQGQPRAYQGNGAARHFHRGRAPALPLPWCPGLRGGRCLPCQVLENGQWVLGLGGHGRGWGTASEAAAGLGAGGRSLASEGSTPAPRMREVELGWGKGAAGEGLRAHALGHKCHPGAPLVKGEVWVPVGAPSAGGGLWGLWGRDRGALGARPLLVAQPLPPCGSAVPWPGPAAPGTAPASTSAPGTWEDFQAWTVCTSSRWGLAVQQGEPLGVQGPEHPKAWA